MPFEPAKEDLFVMTACILHNYLLHEIKDIHAENQNSQEMNQLKSCNINASSRTSRMIRDEISDYCTKEGAVSWQNKYILK